MAIDLPGRRPEPSQAAKTRLPAGQKTVEGWPVLTYGDVPIIDLASWKFVVTGLVEEEVTYTWEQFLALPQTASVSDIHCVTRWSKFDNRWEGVAFKDVIKNARPKPDARFVMVHCYGGYTTNLALADLEQDGVLFAHTHGGKPLPPEHGGPLRLVVPHLYFWKSAKWVRGLVFIDKERPGFWEMYGYHIRGDPWREERYS